jgi:ATP-dependent Clp protease ATP-binding subunit ClpA
VIIMLFEQEVFCPEHLRDWRAQTVLCEATAQAGAILRGSDILASALRSGDVTVLQLLAATLRPGSSVVDLFFLAAPTSPQPGSTAAPRRTRESFTPAALRALDAFDRALDAHGGLPGGAALELLLHHTLLNLDEQECQTWRSLDVKEAAAQFRAAVEYALAQRSTADRSPGSDSQGNGPASAADVPFGLPPEVAPSEDLTHRARVATLAGEFPFDNEPAYDRLFDAIARVLHRQQCHHVLLAGEPGVGKSTVLAELGRRAAAGVIPFLADRRLLRVDCRYVPPDESRQRLAALLAHTLDCPELIVCLDGFASLLRSERPAGNRATLLAGLSCARCQFLGLLTPREYEELIADDRELTEFFARVEVAEPDPSLALKLLRHYAAGLEERFRVAIDGEAVRQAVVLSANYILNDQLPAKALKILHRVCEDLDYARSQPGAPPERVTADHVVGVVADLSGVPEETLRGIAEQSDYEQSLRGMIFGQDHAVAEVATELGLIKAGMTDPDKPASVMLFLGQTGTGKTEMAKALARFYSTSKRLKTYTLGNCVEPHSVATIIGVPPGYVGHDQGGRLVHDLNSDPYCVFLLDEADKAHPDVLQPFLNLFDEGWVCDQRGVRGYANRSIFILTSNVGQRMIAEMAQGGKTREEIAGRMKEALSQIRHSKSDRPVFTPEFLARIKRLIVFNPLDGGAMAGISRKLLAELQENWAAKRGKRLHLPEPLIAYVAEQAHQANERSKGKEGGRVVRKLIAEWVEAPLQRAVSQRPAEYRAADAVVLDFMPPQQPPGDWGPSPPTVTVNFCREPTGGSPLSE